MLNVIMRKPIICAEGSEESEGLNKSDYKYRRKAYAGHIELWFYTDLDKKQVDETSSAHS